MTDWKPMKDKGNAAYGYEKGNWGVTVCPPNNYNADWQARFLNYKTNEHFVVPGNRLAEMSHKEVLRGADMHIKRHNMFKKIDMR